MPELRNLPLGEIDEPSLPIRIAMSDRKMDDLCDSMSKNGLFQPIGVKPVNGRYEIEFGHRRFLAAGKLRWKTIPALIFQPDELQAGAAMLAENICRENITAAEEALLFAQAQEKFSLDEDGLVNMFRRTSDYIADRLRLLRDDTEVFKALQHRKINFSVARELNKIPDEAQRRYYLDCAIRGGVNARTVMGWRQQYTASLSTPSPTASADPPAAEEQQPSPPDLGCFLCGGNRDPWNLESVYIHKYEKEHILKMLKDAAQVEGV
jgi:ParB family chromosome partitioning protein